MSQSRQETTSNELRSRKEKKKRLSAIPAEQSKYIPAGTVEVISMPSPTVQVSSSNSNAPDTFPTRIDQDRSSAATKKDLSVRKPLQTLWHDERWVIFTDYHSHDIGYINEIPGLQKGQFLVQKKSVSKAITKWRDQINENSISKIYLNDRMNDYSGELSEKGSSSKKAAGRHPQKINLFFLAAVSVTTSLLLAVYNFIGNFFRVSDIGDDEDREISILSLGLGILALAAFFFVIGFGLTYLYQSKLNKRITRDNLDANFRELLKRLPAIEYELILKIDVLSRIKAIMLENGDQFHLSSFLAATGSPEDFENELEKFIKENLAVIMDEKNDLNKYKILRELLQDQGPVTKLAKIIQQGLLHRHFLNVAGHTEARVQKVVRKVLNTFFDKGAKDKSLRRHMVHFETDPVLYRGSFFKANLSVKTEGSFEKSIKQNYLANLKELSRTIKSETETKDLESEEEQIKTRRLLRRLKPLQEASISEGARAVSSSVAGTMEDEVRIDVRPESASEGSEKIASTFSSGSSTGERLSIVGIFNKAGEDQQQSVASKGSSSETDTPEPSKLGTSNQ